MNRSTLAIVGALVLAACSDDGDTTSDGGSSEDGGDSGSVADSGGGEDATADGSETCTGKRPRGGASSEGCTAEITYTCGIDSYGIYCACPAASCTCTKNGVAAGTASYGHCPSCPMAFDAVARECGIPSPGDVSAPPGGG